MVLQSSGQISLSNIQGEMGGTNPIMLSEYYANAGSGYTSGISGIPNTGNQIKISNFYGKSKSPPAWSSIPSQTITTNTININLSSYVTDNSGTGLNYSITSNPYSNSSISGSTLSITGNCRANQYYITVQVINGNLLSASQNILIIENPYIYDINGSWPYLNASGFNSSFSVNSSGNGTCYNGGTGYTLTRINKSSFTVNFSTTGTNNITGTISSNTLINWSNSTSWGR